MEIGVVTDEIYADPEKSFIVGTELGIKNYELRNLWGKRIPHLDEEDVCRLEELIKEYQVKITALSPGIFKIPLSSPELDFHKGELLKRTIQLGKRLGVDKIIIFGIKRDKEDIPEDILKVIGYLKKIAEKAGENGFEILLENEPGWWADTAENTLKILKGVGLSNFKLNWDPGNLVCAGQKPYPDGYDIIRDYIGNVHFKDAIFNPDKHDWKPVGSGEVDWKGQINALKNDGYQGIITIETHCKPLEKNFRIDYRELRKFL